MGRLGPSELSKTGAGVDHQNSQHQGRALTIRTLQNRGGLWPSEFSQTGAGFDDAGDLDDVGDDDDDDQSSQIEF